MSLDSKLTDILNKTKLSIMEVFVNYTRNSERVQGDVELSFALL